jgi:hypothetical protein
MSHRLTAAVALVLLAVINWPAPLLAQGLDDDMPIGRPDLFLYSDGEAELRSDVDPTLENAAGLSRRGIAFDADVTQFYQGVASGGETRSSSMGDMAITSWTSTATGSLGKRACSSNCGPSIASAKTSTPAPAR